MDEFPKACFFVACARFRFFNEIIMTWDLGLMGSHVSFFFVKMRSKKNHSWVSACMGVGTHGFAYFFVFVGMGCKRYHSWVLAFMGARIHGFVGIEVYLMDPM